MGEDKKDELIDLNKRTVRELVLSLHDKMQIVDKELKQISETQQTMALEVNTIKTRIRRSLLEVESTLQGKDKEREQVFLRASQIA